MSTGLLRVQNRALHPLEVEFQVAVSYPVWVLGVIHYSSRGAQVLFYLCVLNGRYRFFSIQYLLITVSPPLISSRSLVWHDSPMPG